jgi:hypothetical protein
VEDPSDSNSNIWTILEIQFLHEVDNATFQTASDFNCFECCVHLDSPTLDVIRNVVNEIQCPYCSLVAVVVVVVVAVMVCRDYLIISLRQMKDCRNKL